jgi:hypothetical protein
VVKSEVNDFDKYQYHRNIHVDSIVLLQNATLPEKRTEREAARRLKYREFVFYDDSSTPSSSSISNEFGEKKMRIESNL